MILGHGSYGEVTVRDGKAIKRFSKLSHLIQEYMALQYLDDCDYVVHSKGVDFNNLELHMELFDCSLRQWLEIQRARNHINHRDVLKIIHDILIGLIELHDRDLAHGDLKPGNILIRTEPLSAVLGDCGFVSVAKYAKVDRTAANYRDPVISHDSYHDMFSFGVVFLEMVAELKINRQGTYEEFKLIIKNKVHDPEYRKILYNLLHADRERRPSARTLLYRLFRENPQHWIRPATIITTSYTSPNSTEKVSHQSSTYPERLLYDSTNLIHESCSKSSNKQSLISIDPEDRKYIRRLMKKISYQFDINRGQKGYGALLSYIENHRIESIHHRIYIAVTLMILSSVFGKSGFREKHVYEFCDHKYDYTYIFNILKHMLSDRIFINILLAPNTS